MKDYCEDYIEKLRAMILKLCKRFGTPSEIGRWPGSFDDRAKIPCIQEAEDLVKQEYYLL